MLRVHPIVMSGTPLVALAVTLMSCGKEAKPIADYSPRAPQPTATSQPQPTVSPSPTPDFVVVPPSTDPATQPPSAPVVVVETPQPALFPRDEAVGSTSGRAFVRAQFESGPHVDNENIVTLEFANQNILAAKKIEEIRVKPWMTVHGHGAPMGRLKVELLNAHSVKVTGLYFIMSGPWDLLVDLKVDDGIESFTIPVAVP